MAAYEPELVVLSSSDDERDSQPRPRVNPPPVLHLESDEEELLDPDDDPLGEWPRLSPPPSRSQSQSPSPPPPSRKSNTKLKPAKITFAKSKSTAAPTQPEPESDEDVVSYRVTKNPQKKKTAAAAEKEARKAEREQKKADQEREKQLKKTQNELRKNSRPGEAFKFMTVLFDPNFAHKAAVEQALNSAEINHASNPKLILDNCILFERETVYQAMGDDLQLQKCSRFNQEDFMFVYLEPGEIVPKILAQTGEGDEEDIDLVTYVSSLKSTFPKKQITLLVYGMDAYFKKIKKNEHQEYRRRVLNAGADVGVGGEGEGSPKKRRKKKADTPGATIKPFDFQSAMIEVQLKTGVNYRVVSSVRELGLMLVQYTKAIADAPFKRAQREQSAFDWYALADTSGSIKVDKDTGQGLSGLWTEQLQQFNNIGVDSALAIVRKYPTPLDLLEAYERCRTQEEGQALLKDIPVCTGFGPLKKTRRLGPEASKKLFRFFTSTDPERCLGSSLNI